MALDGQRLMAAGSLLGALAASSCCIVPLVLFGLGISGAWIGSLTRLAPYQPYFIAATLGFLGVGLLACASKDSETVSVPMAKVCARPLPRRLVKATLVVATVLVLAALGFDFFAPLLLNS